MPKEKGNNSQMNDEESGIETDEEGYLTQEEVADNLFERSNSQVVGQVTPPDGGESTVETSKIKVLQRNLLDDKEFDADKAQDMFKVAIVSQEASRNFSKNFHKKLEAGKGENILENEFEIDQPMVDVLHKNIKYAEATEHGEFLKQVLENKRPGHVIAVIEGKREALEETFTFEDTKGYLHTYHLDEFYLEGETAKGGSDAKQNMHFYVREDMEKAVSFEKVELEQGEIKFPVGKVSFSTDQPDETTQKYSVLVVHIPNRYIGQDIKESKTHKAFEAYAKAQLEEEIVIGYIGDTNFSRARAEHALPSVGGLTNEGEYVSHTSSGASKFTYFMQAVPLNGQDESFAMQQPSLLNVVDVKLADSKAATDHPSFIIGTLLTSKIANRKANHNIKKAAETSEEDSSKEKIIASDSTTTLSTPALDQSFPVASNSQQNQHSTQNIFKSFALTNTKESLKQDKGEKRSRDKLEAVQDKLDGEQDELEQQPQMKQQADSSEKQKEKKSKTDGIGVLGKQTSPKRHSLFYQQQPKSKNEQNLSSLSTKMEEEPKSEKQQQSNTAQPYNTSRFGK